MADEQRSSSDDAATAPAPGSGPVHDGPDDDATAWAPTPAPAGSLPSWVPPRLGQYRLKRQIGAGGMATVFEAIQDQPRRTVAVKIMKRGVASKSALRRFEYEAQILGRLRHPNIAQVFEASTHADGPDVVPYFVMEYIPNARHLTDYARERKLTTRERLHLFARICDAVHHGHQKGIIHRDLKPGNILVDSHGEPKVIDFGVARATDSDLAITTLQTDIGQLVGTVQYMSPEQCDADPNDLDPRSDVYALGVVLYELLSGRLPYEIPRDNLLRATRIVKEQPPTPPSSFTRTLRGDLELIVLKALKKQREDRYQTVHELQRDIERYLRDEPITAQPPTLLYVLRNRFGAIAHRHPAACLAMIALVSAILAGTVGAKLVFEWTPLHAWVARGQASLAPMAPALEQVRIIQITEDSLAAVEDLARAAGLEDVRIDDVASRRRLHGHLMRRLATARPRCVTWIATFTDPPPGKASPLQDAYDGDFVAGVEALRAEGCEVVIGARDWPVTAEDALPVGRRFAEHVRWGGSTANLLPEADWTVHLAVQRYQALSPSIAAATFAAAHRPSWRPDWDLEDDALGIAYYRLEDPSYPEQATWLEDHDRIPLTDKSPFVADPSYGRRVGDSVGVFMFDPPSLAAIGAATRDYEWALRADNAALRAEFGDRSVIITNAKWKGNLCAHANGAAMPYGIAYAAGIDAVLRGAPKRIEDLGFAVGSLLLAGLAGVLIATIAQERPWLRWALLALAAAAVIVLSVLACRSARFLFDPLSPILCLVLACLLATALHRARRIRST